MADRTHISSGSSFEKQIGYSRAVVVNDTIFVSGTTGYDYSNMKISDSIEEQTEQCFRNIEEALNKAASSLEDVVKVTYILPNKADFEQCWPILRKYLGKIKPAATMLEAGLADPAMKIEFEVVAVRST